MVRRLSDLYAEAERLRRETTCAARRAVEMLRVVPPDMAWTLDENREALVRALDIRRSLADTKRRLFAESFHQEIDCAL